MAHPVTDECENRTAGEDDPDECSDHMGVVPPNCSVQPFGLPRSHVPYRDGAARGSLVGDCREARAPSRFLTPCTGWPTSSGMGGRSRTGVRRLPRAGWSDAHADTGEGRQRRSGSWHRSCAAQGWVTHASPCAARDAVSRAGPRSSPRRGCGKFLRTSRWDHRRLGTRAATRTPCDARARSCRGRRCRRPCLRTPERQHSCQPAPGGIDRPHRP